jgi:hypothetical protein
MTEHKLHSSVLTALTKLRSSLTTRIRTQTGETPFQCPHCAYKAKHISRRLTTQYTKTYWWNCIPVQGFRLQPKNFRSAWAKGPPGKFFRISRESRQKENVFLRIYCVSYSAGRSIQGFRQDFSQKNFNLCWPDFPKSALRSAKADPADLWRTPCSDLTALTKQVGTTLLPHTFEDTLVKLRSIVLTALQNWWKKPSFNALSNTDWWNSIPVSSLRAYKTAVSSSLATHIRRHTGETPSLASWRSTAALGHFCLFLDSINQKKKIQKSFHNLWVIKKKKNAITKTRREMYSFFKLNLSDPEFKAVASVMQYWDM